MNSICISNVLYIIFVSYYDNRMIQQLCDLLYICFSCTCDKKEPALASQAYGEVESTPYEVNTTAIVD